MLLIINMLKYIYYFFINKTMSEKKIWEKNPEQKIIEKKQNKEIIDFANKIFDADEIANIIESIKTS